MPQAASADDGVKINPNPSPVEEVLAGVSVAFSLLSKALACSSIVGTGPLVGLWSAVCLGLTSLIAMRPGVIAGSAAVVVVPLGAFTKVHGLALVPLIIAIAAVLEFLAGVFGFAKVLDLVSEEVLAGFLNALGIALLLSQAGALSTPQGAALAGICAVLTQFLPSAPIPSSLVGLAVATGAGIALNLDVQTLAQKAKDPATFAGGLSALPKIPEFSVPTVDDLQLAVPVAVSIAFISLLETLLAARLVDDKKCEDLCTFFYDENGEIVSPDDGKDAPPVDVPTGTILSLAAGNGLSVLVGGFGGCGLVPQTVLNLNSGGGGQISTGSYAASMILFALVLAPLVGQISVPALAGIMVAVSLDTIQWKPTIDTVKSAFDDEEGSRIRLGILVITGLLCYYVDFAVGITTGVVLDLFVKGKIGGFGAAASGLGLMGSLGLAGTLSLAEPASAAGPAWSHTDVPAWNQGYPMCTAKSQSPIDITTSKVDTANANDSLAKHVTYMPVGSREIVHNSHVMQVNGNFGTFGLPDGTYEVKQFHFHFPAEHEINGKLGAGELHIVHQKKGAEGTDGLAVIGIVLEESKEAKGSEGAFLSSLGFGTELPQNGDKKAIAQPVDLNSFTDELGGGFYHYSGSLTTPPCAEKVHWYVAKKSAPVTKEMIQTFRTRFPENGDNRPVQPVNGRNIVLNDVDLDGEFA